MKLGRRGVEVPSTLIKTTPAIFGDYFFCEDVRI
jgi:hypothetical protein